MEVNPNEIYLKIFLNEKDFNGKRSLQELEKALIDKLTEIDIDVNKQLSIINVASNFGNYWLKRSKINTSKILNYC